MCECVCVCVCFTVHRKDNESNKVRADGLTVTGHTWLNRYWLNIPCVSVCVCVCVPERDHV